MNSSHARPHPALSPGSHRSAPLLHGPTLVVAQAVWLCVVAAALTIFGVAFATRLAQLPLSPTAWPEAALRATIDQLGIPIGVYQSFRFILPLLCALGFVAVGLWLFWRRSSDRMVLLVSLFLITFGALWFADGPQALPAIWALSVRALDKVAWTSFILFFCLFPDGRFVPRWTPWLVIGLMAFSGLGSQIAPLPQWLNLLLFVSMFGIATAAQVYRYRRISGPVQRQQAKWLAFGITIIFLMLCTLVTVSALLPALGERGKAALLFDMSADLLVNLSLLLIPASVAIAVLRYRLWDIDMLINRTLLYSTLTAAVAGIYALTVGALGALFQAQGNLLISLLATGVVAVLFQPLRERLQRGANRLLFGERDEPYQVLARLAQRLEVVAASEAVLPTIVETVAQALKLPYTAIALNQGQSVITAASYGQPVADPVALPLLYQSETIGHLIMAPRAPGEPLAAADERLLRQIAGQAGAAAYAVRLTADLQQARERLVAAREEERRRLRRDLHDGLGPVLASQGLKLAAARQLMPSDPAQADTLLDQVMRQNAETVADIRRLVYALRPPALDELGLVAALRDYAMGAESDATIPAGLHVRVEAPPAGLPALPAAVEVAAYRIVLEGLTNVARHAQARNCIIRLAMDDATSIRHLCVVVEDDGVGLPGALRAGVGLTSMRERAAEIGGRCVIAPRPEGGTHVRAELPLFDEARP